MTYIGKRKSRSRSRSPVVQRRRLEAHEVPEAQGSRIGSRSRSRSGSRSGSRSPVTKEFIIMCTGEKPLIVEAVNINKFMEGKHIFLEDCQIGDKIVELNNDNENSIVYTIEKINPKTIHDISNGVVIDGHELEDLKKVYEGGKRKTRKRHFKKRKSTHRRRRY